MRHFCRWSVPQIAELFRVRQQRVMAVIALKEMEDEARSKGEELAEDVHFAMQEIHGRHERRGHFERHVRLLPTRPAFEVTTPSSVLKHCREHEDSRHEGAHNALMMQCHMTVFDALHTSFRMQHGL
jgi:hypothetical protein